MKLKDLEKAIEDETVVAVSSVAMTPGKPVPTTGRRAIVLGVRQQRRVHSSARWDTGGHPAFDGVRVRFLEGGEEKIVGPRNVYGAWEEYAAEADRVRAERQQREDRLADQKRRAEAAAKALGGFIEAQRDREFRVIGYCVQLDVEVAEELASRALCGP